jgi:hypothetical protein
MILTRAETDGVQMVWKLLAAFESVVIAVLVTFLFLGRDKSELLADFYRLVFSSTGLPALFDMGHLLSLDACSQENVCILSLDSDNRPNQQLRSYEQLRDRNFEL